MRDLIANGASPARWADIGADRLQALQARGRVEYDHALCLVAIAEDLSVLSTRGCHSMLLQTGSYIAGVAA